MKKNKAREILNLFLDQFGLWIALIIQISVMTISMSLLGYQIAIKIGFVLVGFVVVLFAVRAWMKGKGFKNRLLWGLFAFVSVFFSWSFAIVGTDVQTEATEIEITVESDPRLNLLNDRIEENNEKLSEAQRQYDLPDLSGNHYEYWRGKISEYENTLSELQDDYDARFAAIESGELTQDAREIAGAITADRLFYAIPDAARTGRIIELIIFGAIFIGLEITIITAVEEGRSQDLRGLPERAPQDIDIKLPSEIVIPNGAPGGSFAEKESEPIKSEEEENQEDTEQKPYVNNDRSDISEYARVRFKSESPNNALVPKHEALEMLDMNEEVYQQITNRAMDNGLIKIKGLNSYPGSGITKDLFIQRMNQIEEGKA